MRGSVSSGVMRSSTLVVVCAAPENKIRSSMYDKHYVIIILSLYTVISWSLKSTGAQRMVDSSPGWVEWDGSIVPAPSRSEYN